MNLLLLLLILKKVTIHLNKSGCMPNGPVIKLSGLVFARICYTLIIHLATQNKYMIPFFLMKKSKILTRSQTVTKRVIKLIKI